MANVQPFHKKRISGEIAREESNYTNFVKWSRYNWDITTFTDDMEPLCTVSSYMSTALQSHLLWIYIFFITKIIKLERIIFQIAILLRKLYSRQIACTFHACVLQIYIHILVFRFWYWTEFTWKNQQKIHLNGG